MIKYIRHHFIDYTKYDHCVRMDEHGLIYGFSWYLNSVCEDWDVLVLNDYEAVWPLPVRYKWGIKYFYRPFAVQQLGIFSKTRLNEKVINAFINEMQRRCYFAEVYLNEGQVVEPDHFKAVSCTLNTNLTLNLKADFREIYHGYTSNTRRNVNKSSKNELQLFEQDDPGQLIRIFKSNRGVSLDLPEEFYRNMEKVMYRCLHNNMGKVWTVYGRHNSVCAGAFFVETEKRHTMLFTAVTDEGKELRAMHYLINEYLIYESGKPKVFDFEGSNLESLARFYQGFGSEKQCYQGLHYKALPLPLRWLKRLKRKR